MSEHLREGAALVRRAVAGTFDFTGRSRRLEVGWYWLSASVAGVLAQTAAEAVLDFDPALIAGQALELALLLPFYALLARRLHDQGRSGWWVLMAIPLEAFKFYQTVRIGFHPFDPAWTEPGYLGLILFPLAALMLLFVVAPGDIETNRYGPDPRLDPDQLAPT